MANTEPKRIQRQRVRGWRMPANTVCVTRPGKHGNPYFPGCGIGYGGFAPDGRLWNADVRDPRVQVQWFVWKMEDMRKCSPKEYAAYLKPLIGKNLACWCKIGDPCHGDILLKLANSEEVKKMSVTKIVFRDYFKPEAVVALTEMGTLPRQEVEIDSRFCTNGRRVAAAAAEAAHGADYEQFAHGGIIVVMEPVEFAGNYNIFTEYEPVFSANEFVDDKQQAG